MHAAAAARLAVLASAVSSVTAVYQGFNYGATFGDGTAKQQADFEQEFTAANGLVGAPGNGFTSARLYTMMQAGVANQPISAIPAAISTGTTLLLGLWASGSTFDAELAVLKAAISQYGSSLQQVTAAISVGSEDLYRISPTGITNQAGVGTDPNTIVNYISQVRAAIAGTPLANTPVGHTDTWNAWTNGSNSAVIDACDWIGMDTYPYFQNTMSNSITDAKSLFLAALSATQAAVGGKPVWVTETGFPISGHTENLAVPSISNAKTYWDEVGCPLFGSTNTYWYTLQDADSSQTPDPSFGIVGSTLSTTPLFDISCGNVTNSTTSSSSTPSSTVPTSSGGSSTNNGTAGMTTGGATGTPSAAETSAATSTLSGYPAGGSSGTISTPTNASGVISTPTPSASEVVNNGAGTLASSIVGAFAAVLVAVFAM